MANLRLSPSRLGATLSFLLSALFAITIIGTAIANPFNTSWITHDVATMQFGWEQYRADGAYLFSLATDRASWPIPIKDAMFDNMPIIALICKILSPILPASFQYFGPMFVLGAGLQGLFAYLLLRARVGVDNTGWQPNAALVIGALFFATAPILYVRFLIGHPPLTTQWVIVAALWLYVRGVKTSLPRSSAHFALLLFFVGGISPYLLVMVAGVFLAHVMRTLSGNRWTPNVLMWLALPIAAALGALMIFGFFDPFDKGVVPGIGYGFYSANMNTLMNALPEQLGSSMLPPLPTAVHQQYEGYGYLGLGGMALVFASVALWRFGGNAESRLDRPLLVVGVGAFLLALSKNITLGTHVVVIPLPAALEQVLTIFRSSGRFIWVSIYIILFFAISSLIRRLDPRWALSVLAGCAVIQAADLAAPFVTLHHRLAAWQGIRFTDPAYADLGRAHDMMLVLPAWQCEPWSGLPNAARQEYLSWKAEPLSFLATDNHLRTNSFYAGRLPLAQAAYHCGAFPKAFDHTPAAPRTAYIFGPHSFRDHYRHLISTHYCDFAEDLFICRADRGKAGLSPRATSALVYTPPPQQLHRPS